MSQVRALVGTYKGISPNLHSLDNRFHLPTNPHFYAIYIS